MEYNFGERVEQLLIERGRTKKSLYDYLKMTGQGFDGMIKNNSISAVRLARIADYFEVPVTFFYKGNEGNPNKTGEAASSLGPLTSIEERMAKLEGQLAVKDQQIAGLHQMLISVLGKSEGATEEPTSPEYASFLGSLNSYINIVAKEHGFDPAMVIQTIPNFTANSSFKLVAPHSQTMGIRH